MNVLFFQLDEGVCNYIKHYVRLGCYIAHVFSHLEVIYIHKRKFFRVKSAAVSGKELHWHNVHLKKFTTHPTTIFLRAWINTMLNWSDVRLRIWNCKPFHIAVSETLKKWESSRLLTNLNILIYKKHWHQSMKDTLSSLYLCPNFWILKIDISNDFLRWLFVLNTII